MDFLLALDRDVFLFINQSLATPVGDVLWPLITDYDKQLPVRILLILAWLWMLVKGGRRGRTTALLLIPLIFITDKLNSEVLKELFERSRPCHEIGGERVVQGVRLLVNCGPGNSFPSSHAVNNFAVALLLARYLPKWTWAFFVWAGLVAISRVFVGVHYPLDALGGAAVGLAVASLVLLVWSKIEERFFSASKDKPIQDANNASGPSS